MADPAKDHIHPLRLEYSGLVGGEVYARELSVIQTKTPVFLRLTKATTTGHDLPKKRDHVLVVDRDGRFYWWPRWLNLTTSTGWLRSVATITNAAMPSLTNCMFTLSNSCTENWLGSRRDRHLNPTDV